VFSSSNTSVAGCKSLEETTPTNQQSSSKQGGYATGLSIYKHEGLLCSESEQSAARSQ
jgi:hypothetical protein